MKYPDDYINKVICGDCLEVMKDIPNKSVDLVLTDPPYGKQWARGKYAYGVNVDVTERKENLSWDKYTPTQEVFDEIFRVSKNQIIWGANYFWEYLRRTNCMLVWDKVGDFQSPLNFSDFELAWTSFNSASRKFISISRGFIRDTKDKRQHPTQKPLEMFNSIISRYSNYGDTILDPFLGSGTTAVAAKQLGRNFIGIEINPDYCKIAENRLVQIELFISNPVIKQEQLKMI